MTRNRAEVSEAHVSGGDDDEGPLDGDDNCGRATGSGAAEAMPRPRCAGAAVQRYVHRCLSVPRGLMARGHSADNLRVN